MRTTTLILLIALSSCSRKEAVPGVIAEDQFVHYYADLLVLRQESTMNGTDSTGMRAKVDSLNHAYSVSEEQVRKTLLQYKMDLPRWKGFFERVVKRIEALQQPDSQKQ